MPYEGWVDTFKIYIKFALFVYIRRTNESFDTVSREMHI